MKAQRKRKITIRKYKTSFTTLVVPARDIPLYLKQGYKLKRVIGRPDLKVPYDLLPSTVRGEILVPVPAGIESPELQELHKAFIKIIYDNMVGFDYRRKVIAHEWHNLYDKLFAPVDTGGFDYHGKLFSIKYHTYVHEVCDDVANACDQLSTIAYYKKNKASWENIATSIYNYPYKYKLPPTIRNIECQSKSLKRNQKLTLRRKRKPILLKTKKR